MNTRLWVKICGMTDAAGIAAAAAAGANAVGFVFYPPSPRNLSVAQAVELQAAVPAGVRRVAVFLHPAAYMIALAVVSSVFIVLTKESKDRDLATYQH